MARKKGVFLRQVYKYSRLLHVYVSSALFSLLVFFCVTGVVLNHLSWLNGSSVDGSRTLKLPLTLAALNKDAADVFLFPPLAELQEILALRFNLKSVSDVSLDVDAGEIILDYKLPAGYAAAIWVVGEPTLLVEYRKGGFWDVLGDLHKGRHSGPVWAWVVDVTAVIVVFFALTGMLILWQNRKYRFAGSWLFILGSVTPVVIYGLWVPRLTGL